MKKILLILPILFVLVLTGAACTQQKVTKEDIITPEPVDAAPVVQIVKDLPGGVYQADLVQSRLGWFASKLASNAHTGVVDIKSGNLIMENGVLTGGEFVINLTTMRDIDNTDGMIKHIKSADFFDVEKYPESKFVITGAKLLSDHKDGSASYTVIGDLTIKEKTNPVEFEATLSAINNELRAVAQFSIDRTKWDLTYGSGQFFKEMGDKAIKDNIDYDISLVTKLAQ
jgi:polyisoprenoid-binding protein YceI